MFDLYVLGIGNHICIMILILHRATHTCNIGSIGLASAPVDLVLKYQVGMQSGDSASSMFVYLILFKLCPKGHEWFAYYVVYRSIIG